jgi:hypothetical protein
MSDLQTLFPNQELVIAGETLTLRPFTFGQLPKVLKLTKSFYNEVQPFLAAGLESNATAILEVLAAGGDDLIELIALGVHKPRTWFDTLEIDDGVRVVTAFLEVNLSFFAQRVLPQVKTAVTQLQSATAKLSPSL